MTRPYAVGQICLRPGVHEMECPLSRRDVRRMLDQFYAAVGRYGVHYDIIGTSVKTIGGRQRMYVVRYRVNG